MTYQIVSIPDLPLVMIHFDQEFGDTASLAAYARDLRAFYDNLAAPVYHIADLSDLKLNFDELVNAIQIVIRGENSIVRHPNNLELVLVTPNRFYQVAAKGLNTATFGNVRMLIFETIEAALKWVEEQAA